MINTKARSFVAIMMVIAVVTLLLRIGTERVIKVTIAQNEVNARETLKLISAALENYAKDHLGAYPTDFSLLLQPKPAYLDQDYLGKSFIRGYEYSCPRLDNSGYSCLATVLKCKLTGRLNYTVTTGGILISEECSK
jgi:hypothetical protein